MKMMLRRDFLRVSALGLAGLPLIQSGVALAADYPTKPVRWVVGYPPGGSTDILARLMGNYLTEKFHQQFVIENKPGAGNNIATEYVINSPPDGYTVYLVNPANGINASLYKKLNFNFVRDMAPVGGILRVPNVMIVHPDVPAKTVAEFITYAKANPGKVNMASSGNGTSVHLSGELFMAMTGVKMTHVPYRGSNPALTDMISGQVQVMFDNMPSCLPHIKAGKLRALAVTTAKRTPALPELPPIAESGLPGFDVSSWYAIFAPARTPPVIVRKASADMLAALNHPETRSRLDQLGVVVIGSTPEGLAAHLRSEMDKWGPVIREAGIKAGD
jgi:tripartite-type tricarboxylate transporter receptor subunit TctC